MTGFNVILCDGSDGRAPVFGKPEPVASMLRQLHKMALGIDKTEGPGRKAILIGLMKAMETNDEAERAWHMWNTAVQWTSLSSWRLRAAGASRQRREVREKHTSSANPDTKNALKLYASTVGSLGEYAARKQVLAQFSELRSSTFRSALRRWKQRSS